jgi:hypothetical protein
MDKPKPDDKTLPPEYGVEVMCASWNPVVAAVAEPIGQARAWLAERSAVDADTFLAQFYRCQQS